MRGKSGEADVIGSELELEFEVRCDCQLCKFPKAAGRPLIIFDCHVHHRS